MIGNLTILAMIVSASLMVGLFGWAIGYPFMETFGLCALALSAVTALALGVEALDR